MQKYRVNRLRSNSLLDTSSARSIQFLTGERFLLRSVKNQGFCQPLDDLVALAD